MKLVFAPADRSGWPGVSDAQWADWRWQLRNRLCQLDEIAVRIELTPAERAGILLARQRLALAITPHFFSLIDPLDPDCPIRRQVIPRLEETHRGPHEMADPCGEESHSPVPGLVHRYPDRVLLLVTDRCAAYCRYCTRGRLVGGTQEAGFRPELEQALRYIEATETIRDVLISGGDPLLLGDSRLDRLLARLRAIEHVEFLRIGTRIPVFLPQRITSELVAMLRRHHPLWMSIHMNHPREATREVRDACARLADAGIPLGNQTVLLRGVNDDPATMRELVHRLLAMRVRPYYIYQCDPVLGTAHLRSTVQQGLAIIESLRGHTTGYAVPTFVIDAPGGGGKIALAPDCVEELTDRRVVLRNYEGKRFVYRQEGAPRAAVLSEDLADA